MYCVGEKNWGGHVTTLEYVEPPVCLDEMCLDKVNYRYPINVSYWQG